MLCATVIYCSLSNAQDVSVENYLQQAAYYAEMYNGKIEEIYNAVLYKELPYYKNAEFTETTIVYKNKIYPNQKARLDLFREQLAVVSPEKQYAIVVGSSNVGKIYMYGKTFVWLTPPKDSRLTPGYYMQLFEGKEIQLFCKEKYTPRKSLENEYTVFYFDYKIRYYLLYNNRYYTVKNKALFVKLFPQYKKYINKFVKDHQLNFRQNPAESLASLAAYCEELTNSTNKQ